MLKDIHENYNCHLTRNREAVLQSVGDPSRIPTSAIDPGVVGAGLYNEVSVSTRQVLVFSMDPCLEKENAWSLAPWFAESKILALNNQCRSCRGALERSVVLPSAGGSKAQILLLRCPSTRIEWDSFLASHQFETFYVAGLGVVDIHNPKFHGFSEEIEDTIAYAVVADLSTAGVSMDALSLDSQSKDSFYIALDNFREIFPLRLQKKCSRCGRIEKVLDAHGFWSPDGEQTLEIAKRSNLVVSDIFDFKDQVSFDHAFDGVLLEPFDSLSTAFGIIEDEKTNSVAPFFSLLGTVLPSRNGIGLLTPMSSFLRGQQFILLLGLFLIKQSSEVNVSIPPEICSLNPSLLRRFVNEFLSPYVLDWEDRLYVGTRSLVSLIPTEVMSLSIISSADDYLENKLPTFDPTVDAFTQGMFGLSEYPLRDDFKVTGFSRRSRQIQSNAFGTLLLSIFDENIPRGSSKLRLSMVLGLEPLFRSLYAEHPVANLRGLKPRDFNLNTIGLHRDIEWNGKSFEKLMFDKISDLNAWSIPFKKINAIVVSLHLLNLQELHLNTPVSEVLRYQRALISVFRSANGRGAERIVLEGLLPPSHPYFREERRQFLHYVESFLLSKIPSVIFC